MLFVVCCTAGVSAYSVHIDRYCALLHETISPSLSLECCPWQALPLECCPWQVDGEFFRIFSPELLEVAWECSIRVLQADPDPE